jgi:hypothetical protein
MVLRDVGIPKMDAADVKGWKVDGYLRIIYPSKSFPEPFLFRNAKPCIDWHVTLTGGVAVFTLLAC